MAMSDEFEVVKEVEEYFADYLPHYTSLVTMSNALLADGIDDPPNVSTNRVSVNRKAN